VSSARQDIQAGKLEPVIPVWDPNACNAITDVLEQHRCHAELGRDFAISTGDLARCRVIPLADIQADCRSAIIINQIKTLVALENTLDAGDPGVAIP
jgi:hypothetical protein